MWAGEQTMMMLELGTTSFGSLDTQFSFPVRRPLLSQDDFAVFATMWDPKSWGREVKMFILNLGLNAPITAADALHRLPPPTRQT